MHVPYDPDRLDGQPDRCPPCQEHFAVRGEDTARLLTRLTDHDERLRPAYAGAWTAATELEQRMTSALHSRDTWRDYWDHDYDEEPASKGRPDPHPATVRRAGPRRRSTARPSRSNHASRGPPYDRIRHSRSCG